MEQSQPIPRRRQKRVFRLFALGITIMVVGAGAWMVMRFAQADRELRQLRAQLDATEPGWRMSEVIDAYERRIAPPHENIHAYATHVRGTMQTFPHDFHRLVQTNFNRLVSEPTQLTQLPAPMALAEARRQLQQYRPAAALAHGVRTRTGTGYKFVWPPNPFMTLLPHADTNGALRALLMMHAVVVAADNDPDDALKSCLAAERFGRAFDGEPFLVTALIRMSTLREAISWIERTLALTQPANDDLLRELQEAIATPTVASSFVTAIHGERAMMDAGGDYLRDNPSQIAPTIGQRRSYTGGYFQRGEVLQEQIDSLKYTTAILHVLRTEPSWKWKSKVAAIAEPHWPASVSIFSKEFGDFIKVTGTTLDTMARQQAMTAAIACERFRIANGRWPATLDELAPRFLAKVPTDPHTGRPMLLRTRDDGIILYSTGVDHVDDHGELLADHDTYEVGKDIGVKLWSPSARRVAAPRRE